MFAGNQCLGNLDNNSSPSRIEFGKVENQMISLFALKNRNGMVVKIMDYGATITSIQIPTKLGIRETTCGFDKLDGYLSKRYTACNPYFGSTVGRYANRIKDGSFNLDGKKYQLAINNHSNHLHGGIKGFDKRIWKVNLSKANDQKVTMSLKSLHFEEGYPGELEVKVTFELNNANELSITYYGVADRKTPVSLTNHTYFNLSGFAEDIARHKVEIHSNTLLKKTISGCPDGSHEKMKSTFDFSEPRLLESTLGELSKGIDHYYVFDKVPWDNKQVARVSCSLTGVCLELETSEPGMQFFTALNLNSDITSVKTGKSATAFCCEPHRYPNGPNIMNSPGSFTSPNEPYQSENIYRFSWDDE